MVSKVKADTEARGMRNLAACFLPIGMSLIGCDLVPICSPDPKNLHCSLEVVKGQINDVSLVNEPLILRRNSANIKIKFVGGFDEMRNVRIELKQIVSSLILGTGAAPGVDHSFDIVVPRAPVKPPFRLGPAQIELFPQWTPETIASQRFRWFQPLAYLSSTTSCLSGSRTISVGGWIF